jgi:mannose-1-phosphate guanylyltransferase
MKNNTYAVILAGGRGTRFWPKSRTKSPKQLCRIGHPSKTMIEVTLDRLESIIPAERRIIVTHVDQLEGTKNIVGDRVKTILAEPSARDTGHALALAALYLQKNTPQDSQPIMISLHADAVIQKVDSFIEALERTVEAASTGSLTLMGIVPDVPATGFGYIEKDQHLPGITHGFTVKSFKEKPNLETAREYLASGNFFWNSGIFTWRIADIIEEFKTHMPDSLELLEGSFEDPAKLKDVYNSLPKISIDKGILEKSPHVKMVTADIGWQDVGSWDAMPKIFPTDESGNFLQGDVLAIDSQGCTLESDGPLIAAVGLKDLVVVHYKGAILVCPKDKAQEVKNVVATLHASGRENLT